MNKTPNFNFPTLTDEDDIVKVLDIFHELFWDDPKSAVSRIDSAVPVMNDSRDGKRYSFSLSITSDGHPAIKFTELLG